MLNELDNRLSTVKRWAILPTNRIQSVAEHCFNVQRIIIKIAPWFNITDPEELFSLSQAALHHDDNEALVGDIPSTAKSYVQIKEIGIDTGAAVWYDVIDDKFKDIIKLADMMEACHFLSMEAHLGNQYIRLHLRNLISNMFLFIADHKQWPSFVYSKCDEWIIKVTNETSQPYPLRKP